MLSNNRNLLTCNPLTVQVPALSLRECKIHPFLKPPNCSWFRNPKEPTTVWMVLNLPTEKPVIDFRKSVDLFRIPGNESSHTNRAASDTLRLSERKRPRHRLFERKRPNFEKKSRTRDNWVYPKPWEPTFPSFFGVITHIWGV